MNSFTITSDYRIVFSASKTHRTQFGIMVLKFSEKFAAATSQSKFSFAKLAPLAGVGYNTSNSEKSKSSAASSSLPPRAIREGLDCISDKFLQFHNRPALWVGTSGSVKTIWALFRPPLAQNSKRPLPLLSLVAFNPEKSNSITYQSNFDASADIVLSTLYPSSLLARWIAAAIDDEIVVTVALYECRNASIPATLEVTVRKAEISENTKDEDNILWKDRWRMESHSPKIPSAVDLAFDRSSDLLVIRGSNYIRFYSIFSGKLILNSRHRAKIKGFMGSKVRYVQYSRMCVMGNFVVLSQGVGNLEISSLFILSLDRTCDPPQLREILLEPNLEISSVWGSYQLGVFCYTGPKPVEEIVVCSLDNALANQNQTKKPAWVLHKIPVKKCGGIYQADEDRLIMLEKCSTGSSLAEVVVHSAKLAGVKGTEQKCVTQ